MPSPLPKNLPALRALLAVIALAGCGGVVELTGDAGATGGTSTASGAGGAPGTTASTGATGGTGGAGAGTGGPACTPGDPPMMIAPAPPGTLALAIDDFFVYFWSGAGPGCAKAGSIARVAKTGGPIASLWDTTQPVDVLAVDGAHVYFTDNPTNPCTLPDDTGFRLYAGLKSGGPPAEIPLSAMIPAASAMVLDGGRIYLGANPIVGVNLDGSGSEGYVVGPTPVSDLALDDTFLYAAAGVHLAATAKAPKGGPMFLFESSPSGVVRGLAIDESHLYFGGWEGCNDPSCMHEMGAIHALSKDPNAIAVTLVKRPDRRPLRIVADADSLYWSERSSPELGLGGAVMRSSTQGGSVTEIAEAAEASDLAVDGACVYWAEAAGGGIWKAPR